MSERSAELFRRCQKYIAGGVSRNTLMRLPHPLYASRGSGCRLVDVDGVERIDFANNMASLIHGHAFPPVVEAVTEQLKKGTAYTMATEAEIELARCLCERSPGFDRIRFMNSGTEAVMAALKAARAFTGRPRIAKVEGTYHGAYDFAEVSQSPSPEVWGDARHPASVPLADGTPSGVLHDVVVLPFDDTEGALAVLDAHRSELGGVLIDLMPHRAGLMTAAPDFVAAIRDWTARHGVVLIFDEVITFRTEVGGLQERYGIRSDLTTMGKIIGGGFPVGAVAGREEVMEVFSLRRRPKLPHSGTFSANPVTMTAGRVAMEHYGPDEVARLNRLGDLARQRMREAIRLADVPATVTGTGSALRIHMKPEVPTAYRSSFPSPDEKKALDQFLDAMTDDGILLTYSTLATMSTPMREAEVDRLAEATLRSLRKVDRRLFDRVGVEVGSRG